MAKNNNGKKKSTYVGAPKKNANSKDSSKTTKKETLTERAERYAALTDTSGVDGYFRPEVAVSRWKLGYEVYMGNFLKMLGLNLVMLIFMAPILVLLFFRMTNIYASASVAPFSSNIGVGYLPFGEMLGFEESIKFYADYNFFLWIPAASLLLAIGLSGGMYVMRNFCWGESVQVVKAFLSGIKKNFLPMMGASLIYAFILSFSAIFISQFNLMSAVNGSKWYLTVGIIVLYVVIAFSTMHYMAMTSMIVTYTGNFFQLMKNCAIFTVVLLPINAFFAIFALLPFAILLLGSSALSLGIMAIAFLGAAFTMLVWTDYSHWVYAKYLDKNVKSHNVTVEEINKHNERVKQQESAREETGYSEVGKSKSIMDGVKPVTDYDVKVSDLDEVFTREDISATTDSKNNI